MNDSLELYVPQSDLKPLVEKQVRDRIIKEHAIELCSRFPQAFRLITVGFEPRGENGTWGKYPFDETYNLWIQVSHQEALNFLKKISTEEREMIMSQELTKKEDVGIKQMLAANIKAIKTVLPKHMTPERMMRVAYTAISRSPGLARCTPVSLLNAVIEASMLGLEVNSPLGQASMVPFWNGKTKQFEAQLIPEYKGKIELAYRSGMVKSFQAHAVFEADEFKYRYGLNPDLTHIPSKKSDRGKLVAAYAVVNYINGGVDFEVIEEAEAMAAKSKSASARQDEKNKTTLSVWNSEDEPSMWVKTAVHRLFKRVPKSPEYQQIARAHELAEQAEAGEPQDFSYLDADFSESTIEEDAVGKALPMGTAKESEKPPEVEKEKKQEKKPEEEPPLPEEPPPSAKEKKNTGERKQSPPNQQPPPPPRAPEEPPKKPESVVKEEPKDDKDSIWLTQARIMAKVNKEIYDKACKDTGIQPMSEAGAKKVMQRINEIIEGK